MVESADMETKEQAEAAAAALEAAKGGDVKMYDVRGVSALADFFVVATGAAAPHLKALATAARTAAAQVGCRTLRQSGDPESGWIAVDCGGFVVHVFSREARAYYALERLWERPAQDGGAR